MTSSGRKRNISELLNGEEDASQLPTTRQKVDQGIDRQIPSYDSGGSTSTTDADIKTRESAFLAYPNLSNRKPVSVLFQQPSQLISFSYDASHNQGFDDSALRYFVQPRLRSDLSYGYDRWIKRPDERGRVDALLKAISKAKKDGESKGVHLPEIGVVSWRGVMTKILTAPYENRDGFELNVMYLNGTLYFEEQLSEQRLQEKNKMEPRQRTQTYYGYAFESYCTAESPLEAGSPSKEQVSDLSPGWGGDVNTNVQWCSVVRTKLGDTRMILGGEVDCVRGKYTGQTDTFVELKTSLVIRGRQDEERFEKKLLKFYFQSFLLGVPEIVVGFRTHNGMLKTVQIFKTVQIPRLVRGKPGGWDPLICLEFGHQFLGFLKSVIQDDNQAEGCTSSGVWRVKFVPGSGLAIAKLNAGEVDEVVNGEDRVGFLPRWYWDEIQGAVQDPIRPDTASDGASDTHMGSRSEHLGKGRQIYQ